MAEPSDRARDLVASYRRARVLDDDARARVHDRLLASIDAPIPLARPDRRRVVTIAAIALATAAAVILAAQWIAAPSEHVATPPRDEASHDERAMPERGHATPAEPPQRAMPAEPPATTSPVESASMPSVAVQRPTRVEAREPVDALAAENALVAAARDALARGDHATALAKLSDHARSFPNGQLAEERAALRIEALCAAGKHAQGRAEAKQFLRDHPGATQAARVEAACD
jgi:RNA polymerase sigma-70 factor (ECF subfamily)